MNPGDSLKKFIYYVFRPRKYFIAAMYLSMGGFLNGYDTGSIGSITEMPNFESSVQKLSPTMRGLTVSFLMLAAVIPSLISGILADRFGHLSIVVSGTIFFTCGCAMEAGANNLALLLVGRTLAGVGEGLYLGNMIVYICEIAPKAQRGMMVAMPQMMVTLGTCLGYFTCYGTIKIAGDMQWRLPFIIQAAGGLLFAVGCLLLPKSPRWLISHNKREAALHSMKLLDFEPNEIDEDLNETVENEVPTTLQGFKSLFRKEHRFRTCLALFVLGMVQLCGIDGVLYYAPTIFAQAGLPSDTASFVASGVSGILMFAISMPAFLCADAWNRRTSVIAGGLTLSACMVVIGSLYASDCVHHDEGAGRWIVIVLVFVFVLAYVSTWGIVGKIYASEIQPASHRATANALAQALNLFTNFLAALITPMFLANSPSGPYFLFAGLSLLTLGFLWLYMPETKGRSLESIQETFHPPMKDVAEKASRRRESQGRDTR